MFGPQHPPRTAAWSGVRTASKLWPASCTKTAPKSRRRHDGIWRGRRSLGHSAPAFLAIQMGRSSEGPRIESS
eukprot:15462879-Alexandrium_andersonii.AAC.1